MQSKLLIHMAQWGKALVRDKAGEIVTVFKKKKLNVAFHHHVYFKSHPGCPLLSNKLCQKLQFKTIYYYHIS